MNERIRELAEQAGFYVSNDKIYIPTTSEDITACQTKFAELIVRECASVSKQWFTNNKEYAADLAIKQHFGVEE